MLAVMISIQNAISYNRLDANIKKFMTTYEKFDNEINKIYEYSTYPACTNNIKIKNHIDAAYDLLKIYKIYIHHYQKYYKNIHVSIWFPSSIYNIDIDDLFKKMKSIESLITYELKTCRKKIFRYSLSLRRHSF